MARTRWPGWWRDCSPCPRWWRPRPPRPMRWRSPAATSRTPRWARASAPPPAAAPRLPGARAAVPVPSATSRTAWRPPISATETPEHDREPARHRRGEGEQRRGDRRERRRLPGVSLPPLADPDARGGGARPAAPPHRGARGRARPLRLPHRGRRGPLPHAHQRQPRRPPPGDDHPLGAGGRGAPLGDLGGRDCAALEDPWCGQEDRRARRPRAAGQGPGTRAGQPGTGRSEDADDRRRQGRDLGTSEPRLQAAGGRARCRARAGAVGRRRGLRAPLPGGAPGAPQGHPLTVVSVGPEGAPLHPTKGRTAAGRLRLLDTLLRLHPPPSLTRPPAPGLRPVVVDLGFGETPVTSLELLETLRA